MQTKHLPLLIFSLLSPFFLTAQSGLFIDTAYTAEQMVMDFFDSPSVTISNVTYTGDSLGMAYFEGANTDLGLPAGIILSSGNVYTAIGPNDETGNSDIHENGATDVDLEAISMGIVQDAAILEFDITSDLDTLFFNYVFGSDEYPEFVCSQFNDVFGFFVSGPGISGSFQDSAVNIAVIPGSDDYVTINQLNGGYTTSLLDSTICDLPGSSLENSQFYMDNTDGEHLEVDGFTVPLPAPFGLLPGETYHVKLAIADVADRVYNSDVFIGIESLNGDSLLSPPTDFVALVVGNTVTIENQSRYATSYSWDFGDGTTSEERYPEPHVYTAPGEYDITLVTQNYCCSDSLTFTVMVDGPSSTIDLPRPYQLLTNPVTDQIQLNIFNQARGQAVLYNSTGQQVLATQVAASDPINVAHLAPGVYVLYLQFGGQTYVERVSKL